MKKINRSFYSLIILTSILGSSFDTLAWTVSPFPKDNISTQTEISLGFPPAPSGQDKITTGTQGGGTRGGCTNGKLTPFIPKDQIGKTLSASPSFFIYVPETKAIFAEFVIFDADYNVVYSQQYQTPKQAGIVRIKIKADSQLISLDPEQVYFWEFALVCDTNDRSGDTYTGGNLKFPILDQQQQNNLQQQLETTTNLLEKAAIYANNNIWNETLDLVAQIRNAQPNEWQELLNSIGIQDENIIEAPIVDLEE